jgi:hypothetical protein
LSKYFLNKHDIPLAWQKIYAFAEIVESFLTWNEEETKIVHCVTMENILHSNIINKFHIKAEDHGC